MIQMQTVLKVADNSGAKTVICIKVLGGSGRMIACYGDVVIVAVQDVNSKSKVNKGSVYKALIVRVKQNFRSSNGTFVRFSSNSVILLDKQHNLIGTRVFGPVLRDLRLKGFAKVLSLAEEVL